MKRFMLLTIFLAVILILTIPAAAESNRNFIGRWLATDLDESNMELWITRSGWSGGRLLNLRARDDRTGGWCGGEARMEAIGVLVEDNSLQTSGAWWCINPVENIMFPLEGSLIYDLVTDTI